MFFAPLLSVCASFPVGHWSGELLGVPSGTLGSPTAHTPLLGNGYVGATLSSQRAPLALPQNGSTVDLWINSNSNWDCQTSGKSLPPAHCSTRMLGMLSIGVIGEAFGSGTELETEQRLGNGTLWTRRTARGGTATLETETLIHPDANVLVHEVRLTSSGAQRLGLQATLLTYGPNRHLSRATAACKLLGGNTRWTAACSRRFHTLGGNSTYGFRAPWTALGLTTDRTSALPLATRRGNTTINGYEVEYVTATFDTGSSSTGSNTVLRFVVSLTDNLLGTNDDDPTEAAAMLALSTEASAVARASASFWASFWGDETSPAVSLPTRPAISAMWYGAQYATACAYPTNSMVARTGGKAPPPGLYGPWTTADYAFWNGDFTLDYNQEGNYYHIYSSNRVERSAGYFPPNTAWAAAARTGAVQAAAAAGPLVSQCVGTLPQATHFATHLAPWGAQSRDTSVYGHYNGAFAALPFVSDWEYRRDAAFALNVTLPFLDGVNAFSHCYLHHNTSTGWLEDWNVASPDEVQENNPVRNPVTGVALLRRVATAQRDIAKALGVPQPPYLDDIVQRLVPPPTTDAPKISADGNADASTVWAIGTGVNFSDSAHKYGLGMALFPLFPAETVEGLVNGTVMDSHTRAVARASVAFYGNLSCAPHWPRPPFESCVDAGTETLMFFNAAARALAGTRTSGAQADVDNSGVTALALADALERHVGAYGANASNFLAYAPGGGVETAGLAHALNDMLLQSDGTYIELFPAWPADEPASFRALRAKGAFVVSAAWDVATRTPRNVRIAVDGERRGGGELCGLIVGQSVAVTVQCTGMPPQRLCGDTGGRVRWVVSSGTVCDVVVGSVGVDGTGSASGVLCDEDGHD